MESKLTRRMAISSLGLISGGIFASGCAKSLVSSVSAETIAEGAGSAPGQSASAMANGWKYIPLDPDELADRAYAMYPDGGCMYSMVGSVISTLAERYGEPYRHFPFAMMRYGDGGICKWGSVCGVVNGAGALIGLFFPESQEVREKLFGAFANWYESTELPVYQPKNPSQAMEIPVSVAGSVLCHLSVSQWCNVSGCAAFSKEKSERCRRLTADGMRKLVSLLNAAYAQAERELVDISSEAKECNSCHGKAQLADAMVKMDCRACHDLPASHAVQAGQNPQLPSPAAPGSGS